MAWELAQPEDLPEIVELIERDEWRHVAFSSRIMEKKRPCFPNPRQISIYLNRTDRDATIGETLMVNRSGLVLPVLADGSVNGTTRTDVSALLENASRPLHSLMGETSRVMLIERALNRKIRTCVDYHLMALEASTRKKSHDIGNRTYRSRVKIRRARPRDAVTLYPLQREYEKEEVLLDPRRFNASATYVNLQRSLKREVVFYAEMDNRVVAKAGTNARGIGYDQLGGVYTIPEQRNTGVATYLIDSLINHLLKSRKGVCLFVKRDNPAAFRVYKKLGFTRRSDFRITYYTA